MVNPSELRDVGRLVGDGVAGLVRSVDEVHGSISGRVFRAIGPTAEPVRILHEGLRRGVYSTVALAGAVTPRVAATALRHRSLQRAEKSEGGRPDGPRPRRVIGALNGLKGDLIAAEYPALAFGMALRDRSNGGDVLLTPKGLRAAYPEATGKVVVFVHGLCDTERSWGDEVARGPDGQSVSYGKLLEADLGFTAAYLRYNSGLPVAKNGEMLAELLDEVVGRWPVPIDELVLIGHSMGGLVARTACHRADLEQRPWADSVRHVICVGTPHLGAPLEKGVHRIVPQLDRVPESRPLAKFLDNRSAGVKDLRHGVFAGSEEAGDDLDGYLAHRRREVPFLEGATYHFVAATVTHDRRHPVGRVVGDLLVRYPSSSGDDGRRTIPFELEHGVHVGGLNHFDLLNHPTVYEHLRRWLAPTPDQSPNWARIPATNCSSCSAE